MDKHSSLATAEDLLLDTPNLKNSPPPPPRTLYSIALTLSPPSTSTSASSSSLPSTSPPPPPAPLSLLDQLEPDKEPHEKPLSSSPSNEVAQEGGARFGPVSVDWIDFSTTIPPSSSTNETEDDEKSKTPTGRSDLPDLFVSSSDPHPPKDSLILRSGSTSLPSGTVHLYRHAYPSTSSSLAASASKTSTTTTSTYTTASVTLDHQSPSSSAGVLPSLSASPLSPSSSNNFLPPATSDSSLNADGRLAAVLAVPSYFTPADFLAYVGRAEGEMEALRMIRDVSPSRSLVLIRFRSKEAAEEFIGEFDGRLFNSFEPEQCHVVRIKHVLAHFVPPSSSSPATSSSSSSTDTPPAPVETSPFPEDQKIMEELDGAFELPSCPVCLERLDSEISGLVTVQCDHRFHCQCLARWTDSRCPVCRYSQTATTTSSNPPPGLPHPPTATPSSCSACSTTDSLWICLICGIVGCGRYSDGKHAQRHFESTGHLYALELETQRVWNYAADEYVHRLLLLQNKPGSSNPSSTADDQTEGGGRPSSHSTLVELPPSSTSTPVQHHPSLPSSNLSTANRGLTHQRNSPSGGGGFPQQHPHHRDQQYPPPSEKLEALSLEYSHLLTSQLSAQRTYFSTLQTSLETRVVELEAALAKAQAQQPSSSPLPPQTTTAPTPQTTTELKTLRTRLKTLERDLASERSISSNLLDNLASSKSVIEELKKELASEVEKRKEGEEQVRDLMFFLEARDKIADAGGEGGTGAEGGEGGGGGGLLEELQGGTVGVVVPPTPRGGVKKKKGRK